MKPIKKEDMPKLIVLIVLTIGLFGFALSQFLANPSMSAAAPPPAPGATPAAGAAVGAAAGTMTAQGEEAAPVPELDFLSIGPPVGGRDPFSPNGPAAPAVPTPALVPAAPVVRPLPPVAASSPGNLEKLMGIGGIRAKGMDVEENNPGNSAPGPAVVELPAPAWTIAGIVLAERDSNGIKSGRDVAILRDTTGNRRFVTVGDPADNGYHVSAIRPGGVEIRNNRNHTAIISLNSSAVNPAERPRGAVVNDGNITNTREISGINGATTRAK